MDSTQKKIVNTMFSRFFYPSLFSSFGLALGGIADAVVVGNMVGEKGLAAIAFTWPIPMLFNTVSVGMGVGGSIYYSRYLSEGKVKKALSLFNGCLVACICIGVMMALFGNAGMPLVLKILGAGGAAADVQVMTRRYTELMLWATPFFFLKNMLFFFVRSDDSPKLATAGMVIGNILDIALNCILVLEFDMGVEGAAYATVAGTVVVVLIYLPKLFRKSSILRFTKLCPDLKETWKAYQTGFASSSQYIFQFITIIIVNQILIKIGGQSDVAVYNVVMNVSYVVMSIADAATSTLQPLVSTFYGERNQEAIRGCFMLTVKALLFIGIPVTALLLFFAEPVAAFFGLQDAVGTLPIRRYAFSILLAFCNVLMSCYYQASENIKRGAAIVLLRSLFIQVACILGCSLIPGIGFWWSFFFTELLTLLCYSLYNFKIRDWYGLSTIQNDQRISVTVTSREEGLGQALSGVSDFCERFHADAKQTYYVTLTVEEICGMIMEKAFSAQQDSYIAVTMHTEMTDGEQDFVLTIRDDCSYFNPFEVKSHKMSDMYDAEAMDSMGIHIVRNKTKKFFYRRYQGFNTLRITV